MEAENDHPSRTMPTQNHENISESKTKWVKYLDHQATWLEKTRGNLMIVATVIASMAFQAAVNPPSQLWQSKFRNNPCQARDIEDAMLNRQLLQARDLMIKCINKYNSEEFIICNSVSFSASLSIIFLLTALPLKHRFSLWILLVAISITLLFTSATYIVAMSMAQGSDQQERFNNHLVFYYVFFWVCLVLVILVFVALRVLLWLPLKLVLRVVMRLCRRKPRVAVRPEVRI